MKKSKVKNKTKNNNLKIKYSATDTNTSTIIKNVVAVFLFFALAYGVTVILGKAGIFEKGYTPLEVSTEFSDEYILIGTILNRNESEYYVAFDDFSLETSNVFFNNLINNTSIKTKIYKVDMASSFNSKYKSETSNPKAKSVSKLAIKGATLIKVSNHKIVEYTEGTENIAKILVK